MKFSKKISSFTFFKKITSSNSNESFYDNNWNENQYVSHSIKDEDDTWRLSTSEKDSQNASWTGNLSSDDVQNNDDVQSLEDDSIGEYNEDDLREDTHIFSFSFDNLMFIILFCVFLPMFIRIILFFVLLITIQKDKSIETRKQLHIFYDYELYLEFIRKYDYKLFRYHDPIFGLMDAHINIENVNIVLQI
jgi:hypothetical protein